MWIPLLDFTYPNMIPASLVGCAAERSTVSTAPARDVGISGLTPLNNLLRGSLALSNKGQSPVKQSLGVVETGLSVQARRYSAPQAENVSRVGNLKLMPLTNPTP